MKQLQKEKALTKINKILQMKQNINNKWLEAKTVK